MSTPDLERTAHVVECFLNALRLDDGRDRTVNEEWLVRWLAARGHKKGDCVIYSTPAINCYSSGKVVKRFSVPEATQTQTVWCDGDTLSVIDGEAYRSTGQLLMLDSAGLILSMPGMAATEAETRSEPRRAKPGDR